MIRTIIDEKNDLIEKLRPIEKHHIPNLHAKNNPRHSKHAKNLEKIAKKGETIWKNKIPQLEKPPLKKLETK